MHSLNPALKAAWQDFTLKSSQARDSNLFEVVMQLDSSKWLLWPVPARIYSRKGAWIFPLSFIFFLSFSPFWWVSDIFGSRRCPSWSGGKGKVTFSTKAKLWNRCFAYSVVFCLCWRWPVARKGRAQDDSWDGNGRPWGTHVNNHTHASTRM